MLTTEGCEGFILAHGHAKHILQFVETPTVRSRPRDGATLFSIVGNANISH